MNQQPVISHEAPVHDIERLPVAPPAQLIGRSSDRDALQRVLLAGGAVLLHGMSGIGKTALAAALAADHTEQSGGVLWLEGTNDTLLSLLNRVARAYSLPPASVGDDVASHTANVRAVLQENRPLIVLDGYLRIDAARVFVRDCAAGTPLLLTYSQPAAGSWTQHAVTPLEPDNALALFVHLTGDAIDADMTELAALSDVLAGHPLSIQVAARQVAGGDVSPGDVLAHMPDMPPGDKNRVMGVLMAAYRLLPSDLQGTVMLLGSAFAGGATDELLADVSSAPVAAVRARMRQLVAFGFAAEHMQFDQPYFTAHELIQEFAQAFLRGKKRLLTMQARHMQGLLTYLRRHIVEAETIDYDRLASDMRSVIAASVYAVGIDKLDYVRELAQLLEPDSDSSFVAVYGFQPELDWLKYLIDHPQAASEGVLGRVVEPAAPAAEEEREFVPAEEVTSSDEVEVVSPFQEQDTVQAQSLADVGLEPVDLEPEQETFAETALEATPKTVPAPPEALPEAGQPPDAGAVQMPGQAASKQSDQAGEIARYAEALESFQADGNVEDELAAIQALAKLNLESANYEDVLRYVDRGMSLAQEADNPQREGELLVLLGDLQFSLGRLEGAETAYREAISAFRPTDAWLDIGLTLDKLAELYLEQDRLHEAIDLWQQTIPIFERVKRPDLVRLSLDALGDTQSELMEWKKARASYAEALQLAEQTNDDRAVFTLLSKLGQMLEDSGDRDGAQLFYRRALSLALSLGDQTQLGYVLLSLARLLLDDTLHLNRALQLLQAADPLLPGDSEVKRLLGRARTRRERLVRAGVTLPVVEDTLEDFAQVPEDN